MGRTISVIGLQVQAERAALPSASSDSVFVKDAHRLTIDLTRPRAIIYWLDLVGLAVGIYGGLALAVLGEGAWRPAGAVVFCLALYRGVSFIHELTHLRPRDIPGFRYAWLLLVGVPFLIPTLLYDGVHNLHHAKQRYGTAADPEYAPLSHRSALHIVGFVAIAALAPLGAYLRFAVGTPLSLLSPRLRRSIHARFSAMTVNPAFRRIDLAETTTPDRLAQEIACWLWSWSFTVIAVVVRPLGLRFVLTAALGLAAVGLVNQLRTLVAHAWTNDGAPMSFAAQFRDSINVPPPAFLPMLWAPVGLRYHALHHLLPRIPYHNLAEAHRRIAASAPAESGYGDVAHKGLGPAIAALLTRSGRRRSA